MKKNPADGGGWTPLHNAAFNGHLEVFKFIASFLKDMSPVSNR